jgi:hypothetical protein
MARFGAGWNWKYAFSLCTACEDSGSMV